MKNLPGFKEKIPTANEEFGYFIVQHGMVRHLTKKEIKLIITEIKKRKKKSKNK